jgi:hypothetical protein
MERKKVIKRLKGDYKPKAKEEWPDNKGRMIPCEYIPQNELNKSKILEWLFALAMKMHEELAMFKTAANNEVQSYLDHIAAEYGQNYTGNCMISNFSDTQRIVFKQTTKMVANETINVAIKSVDDCIKSWSEGINESLIAIINDALRVDTYGKRDLKQMMRLFTLEIDDPNWRRAMEALKASIKTVESKKYMYFEYRDDEAGDWKSIKLDFSAV